MANSQYVRVEFENDPHAARQARVAISKLFPGIGDSRLASVTLAASELVTNVVGHTAHGGVLEVWVTDELVRIEVADYSEDHPHFVDGARVGGRGLRVVASTSDRWGVEARANGKVVWAEFGDKDGHR